ncbi:MAG: hypothetical protein R3D30_09815 [Hyphomicrobiales bacterium]
MLMGGNGRDTLYGEQGDDTLYGGAHNDVPVGGGGVDTVYDGEDGADSFVFTDLRDAGDTLPRFHAGRRPHRAAFGVAADDVIYMGFAAATTRPTIAHPQLQCGNRRFTSTRPAATHPTRCSSPRYPPVSPSTAATFFTYGVHDADPSRRAEPARHAHLFCATGLLF